MYKVISPDQFKTIPWKNGLGQTTELAISPGGTIDQFDWRLSIASVVENGWFSDFSGYDRHLVLLDGHGIKLTHNQNQVDNLHRPLSMATFDGSSQTMGELFNGPIHDFNVMSKQLAFSAQVHPFIQQTTKKLETNSLCFVFAANQALNVLYGGERIEIPQGHLLQIIACSKLTTVTGEGFLVINLVRR